MWDPTTFTEIKNGVEAALVGAESNRKEWEADPLKTLHAQKEKVETYVIVHWHYYCLPQVRKAHFIGDREKIIKILHQKRNGKAYSLPPNLLSFCEQKSMLTCPYTEHKRLRQPVERLLSARNINENIARDITRTIILILSLKDHYHITYSTFISKVVTRCLLGLKETEEQPHDFWINTKDIISYFEKAILAGDYEEEKAIDLFLKTESLTHEEKLNSLATLFIAGTHTTSSFVTFLMEAMTARKDDRANILDEWNHFILDKRPENLEELINQITEFALQSKWVEACYLEGQRLYPIIPDIKRVANEDITIDELTICKGDQIHLNIYRCHRDPDLWQEPDFFSPRRFIEDEKLKSKLLPFSVGSQNCVGKNLAKAESMILLSIFVIMTAWNHDAEDLHEIYTEIATLPVVQRTIDPERFSLLPEFTEIMEQARMQGDKIKISASARFMLADDLKLQLPEEFLKDERNKELLFITAEIHHLEKKVDLTFNYDFLAPTNLSFLNETISEMYLPDYPDYEISCQVGFYQKRHFLKPKRGQCIVSSYRPEEKFILISRKMITKSLKISSRYFPTQTK